jgi:hypothetical protein
MCRSAGDQRCHIHSCRGIGCMSRRRGEPHLHRILPCGGDADVLRPSPLAQPQQRLAHPWAGHPHEAGDVLGPACCQPHQPCQDTPVVGLPAVCLTSPLPAPAVLQRSGRDSACVLSVLPEGGRDGRGEHPLLISLCSPVHLRQDLYNIDSLRAGEHHPPSHQHDAFAARSSHIDGDLLALRCQLHP